MPLYLVPPGKRKGNRFFLVRGEVGGRRIEVSSKTRDQAAAIGFKAALELRLIQDRVPGAAESVTYRQATDLYITFKQPSKGDERRIRRIAAVIGDKLVADVVLADLVHAANKILAGRKNETKNRWVIKPGAAILHYASENKWCDWLRVSKLKEAPPETRASSIEVARLIIEAIDKEISEAKSDFKQTLARKKRLLVLWLFKHGSRISDPLRLTWDKIDLQREVYNIPIRKTGKWKEKPLDPEVFELLAAELKKEGRIFPWRTRSGVYKWLRPLTRKLKVKFTPHMARHLLGKTLNATGEGLKTIMGALDHDDPQSSVRYQHADFEIVKRALRRSGTKLLGGAVGEVPSKPAKRNG